MKPIGNHWDNILSHEFSKPYYQQLRSFLWNEYQQHTIYPPMKDIYNALRYTDYDDVKVVIIGQDPYHGKNQAHGLCFSVQKGTQIPPSLQNIYKEIHADIGCPIPTHGDLTAWTKQGVLLLNTVLTVREGQPNSHKQAGWLTFTQTIIQKLNERKNPMVFLLWGANARSLKKWITNPQHKVLETVHPSPLSAYQGFLGCKHFSKCNELLTEMGKTPIDWKIV